MARYHRIAHTSANYYGIGTRVKKGDQIGRIGNAAGYYKGAAHAHWDIFRAEPSGITAWSKWSQFVGGKSKSQVASIYADPNEYGGPGILTEKPFSHYGYEYLELQNDGNYHSGSDINTGSGDSDFGHVILSPVDGVVEYVRGKSIFDGWGGMTVIKEDASPAPQTNKELEEYNYQFIDVSKYQGSMNFADILKKNPEIDGFVIKATQGVSFTDSKFKTFQTAIRKLDCFLGYYHYATTFTSLSPKIVQVNDPKEEADFFVETVGQLQEGEFMVLDVEEDKISETYAVKEWAITFMDRVQLKANAECVLYAFEAYVNEHKLASLSGDYFMWVARYWDNSGTFNPDNKPTANWDMWQWTSHGRVDGYDGRLDMNVANEIPLGFQDVAVDCSEIIAELDDRLSEIGKLKSDNKLLTTKVSGLESYGKIQESKIDELTDKLESRPGGISIDAHNSAISELERQAESNSRLLYQCQELSYDLSDDLDEKLAEIKDLKDRISDLEERGPSEPKVTTLLERLLSIFGK